jgi:uncharacterized protein (UPF0212 family)
MSRKYQKRIYVNLSCIQDKIDEREVEFIDIEEDYMGRDILTFKCPECNKQHRSLRFS